MDLSKLRTRRADRGGRRPRAADRACSSVDWYEIPGRRAGRRRSATSSASTRGFRAWDGQGFFGTIANLVILAAALVGDRARGADRHLAHRRAAGRGERDHRRARHRGGRDGARCAWSSSPARTRSSTCEFGILLALIGAADRRLRRLAEHAGGGHDVRGGARPVARLARQRRGAPRAAAPSADTCIARRRRSRRAVAGTAGGRSAPSHRLGRLA